MLTIFKKNKVESTSLSDFVENTSSKDRKKIYTEVIKKASESQNQILKDAKAIA